ncbi:hypothetical protein [Micromonospora sp. NBC_01796]|uniref:hypothetical protein n=1 Tax=Micromonospora sp. NBC_01796 TaxID=2975987 RepID=UPI002DD7D5DD|nr:hypothetical protein [Micromonospora sp. NBC_01796]WSA85198.1 hypothetical protein OIE47_33380 [Micromonospora sp. NBC_01796]
MDFLMKVDSPFEEDNMVATESPVAIGTGPGDSGIRNCIRRRPLLSFFALANLLSWVAWIPYVLSTTGLGVLDFRFPTILGTTQTLGVLPGAYLGPITAAFIVTAVADGRAGLRRWVGRMLRWRIGWRWYLSVLIGVPAALTITSVALSGGSIQAPPATALLVYLPVLVLQMISTGIAEEPGWRDFATIATAQNSTHVLLLTSAAGALVLLIATRGRLGYRPAVESPTRVVE